MSDLNEENAVPKDHITKALKQGASEFALSMTKLLYNPSLENNVLFSPINIYSALALVYLGADGGSRVEIAKLMGLLKKDGDFDKIHENLGKMITAIESTTPMQIYTGYEEQQDVTAIINVTNGVFVQKDVDLVPSYVSQIRSHYKSEISSLDFRDEPAQATDFINQFISNSTKQRIPTLLAEPVDRSTRLILASCIYFKATWQSQFSEHGTKDENFNTGSKDELVKMMSLTEDIKYADLPSLHVEAISLEYKGNDVSMLIVLPKPGKKLNDVLGCLQASDLQKIVDRLEYKYIDLKLPRMKFSWKADINGYLAQLGLQQVFTDASQLTKMVNGPSLKISKITHAAEIEVDENGTEASAATVIQMVYCCAAMTIPRTPKPFHVNRPFLFYIYHRNTNTVLFLGTVHNPKEE